MPKKIPIEKLVSFETKKSVHINLSRDAHSGLKIACIGRNLSIQEVLDEFAQLVAADHPDAISIIDDLALKKRNKVIRELSQSDADSIFSLIEMTNPLARDES